MSENPLTVLIVDDEPPARDRLERLIAELPAWTVAGTCGTGLEALDLVTELKPAVVLLDIRMPGMTGIEAARHLSTLEKPPAVVFTTAYDEYALEAFESQAVDYLLKPVRRGRLEDALRAARLAAPQLRELAQANELLTQREHVAVRVRSELKLVPLAKILFFRAEQKYVTVRHVNGEELIEESLKQLAEEFRSRFVRIHRSVLIAVSHIDVLEKGVDGRYQVRMRGVEETLPVSRRQVSELKQRMNAGR